MVYRRERPLPSRKWVATVVVFTLAISTVLAILGHPWIFLPALIGLGAGIISLWVLRRVREM